MAIDTYVNVNENDAFNEDLVVKSTSPAQETAPLKFFPTTLQPTTPAATEDAPFTLNPFFIRKYSKKTPSFGFNGLGEMVYKRTYSRLRDDGTNEQWYQTVERVVNGTFNMQKNWMKEHKLHWDDAEHQRTAQDMYERIFEMKFLPPGRGLWAMGSAITEKKKLYAALNNCAFVSTDDMHKHPSKPFTFLMDASMLGVGVGFDTVGAGSVHIKGPSDAPAMVFQIPDSREGWVESLKHLMNSYFYGYAPVEFDYSLIRLAGEPIRGFGGVSSGPQCLKDLHADVKGVLNKNTGSEITVTSIVDIMNLIGRCVVAGNLRRTAEIAFGDPESDEYINLKNYEVNPQRMAYGWTSNNSVFAKIGMDYTKVCGLASTNGEPGFAWLENMRKYDRMNGVVTNKDYRAKGGNPCLEQTLESYEMCCLVESFPNRHETLEDYKDTLRCAFLYAKTVTLGQTHWPETNQVMLRNRRIGTSMSGIAQFIASKGQEALRSWCEEGYDAIQELDKEFSDLFAVPRSIKTTSIKPSGTVSLLAGATPGIHYPISRYYRRRVRLAEDSELVEPLRQAGYDLEPAVGTPGTLVVSFPVDAGEGLRKVKEISMWEQLNLASFLQRHWADNQVSCTITFDPKTEGPQMKHALDIFQYQLKGVSFLPHCDGVYPQMPYEEISKEEFEEMSAGINSIQWNQEESAFDPQAERFCDGDHCTL